MQNRLYPVALLCLAALMIPLAACEDPTAVGLGPSVDLEAPNVQITDPDYMDNVPELFTLSGTVADNRDIARVSVELQPEIRFWRWQNPDEGWMTSVDGVTWSPVTGGVWTPSGDTGAAWSVPVSLTGAGEGEFSFRVTATDARGNDSADSVKERTFVIDNTPPASFVTNPVLSAQAVLEPLVLENPQDISRLVNGQLQLAGFQDELRAVDTLRITLLSTGGDTVYETVLGVNTALWPAGATGNLWNWALALDGSQLVDAGGTPLTGKNLIQVITAATDRAGNTETENHGWFCWWPEADIPWATVPSGSGGDVYPGTTLVGNAYDDDGIASVRFVLRRSDLPSFLEESVYTPGTVSGSVSWTLAAPTGTGSYELSVIPVDSEGTEGASAGFNFTVPDIRAPRLTLSDPDLTETLFGDSAGTVLFSGTATDDQTVGTVKIAWIRPGNDDAPFLTGSETPWVIPVGTVYTDPAGNRIWQPVLGAPVTGADGSVSRSFQQSINLFTDLSIGSGVDLGNQTFIIRVSDGEGLHKTDKITSTGDWRPPVTGFTGITVRSGGTDTTFPVTAGQVLPMMQPGDQVRITGTWSDDSTSVWSDQSRIGAAVLSWNGTDHPATTQTDGTWSTGWFAPGSGAAASVEFSLADWGGNESFLRENLFIETYAPMLTRITSAEDDGFFMAGDTIRIYLEFNKEITFSGGSNPALTLNTGGTAVYVSGNGTRRHEFTYLVGDHDNTTDLDVSALNDTGLVWRDDTGQTADLTALPSGVNSLGGNRNLVLDTTPPTVSALINLTGGGFYRQGQEIVLQARFSEEVVCTGSPRLALDNGAVALFTGRSDGQTLLFTYTVAAGDTSAGLGVSAVQLSGAVLEDVTGNPFDPAGALPAGGALTGGAVVVDTAAPVVPAVSGVAGGGHYYGPVTLTLTGENLVAEVEYSLSGGQDWEPYSAPVVLEENGSYNLVVRQTDRAGNGSPEQSFATFYIEREVLVTGVTSTAADITYKEGDILDIQVLFRKDVTVTGNPSLLLNAVDLNGDPVSAPYYGGSGTGTLVFRYTVGSRDRADRLDYASTGALSLAGVVLRDDEGTNLNAYVSLPAPGSASSLAGNKNIRIQAGQPVLTGCVLSSDNQTLTLEFSQPMYKGSGNLVLEQRDFVVPPLLEESRYSEILSRLSGTNRTLIEGAYTRTINGGSYSGGVFQPDLTAKYVLKYTYDTDDADLLEAFSDAKAHQVVLPVTGSRVTGAGTDTLTVSLTGGYQLPVKGADYDLIIPATAFRDLLGQYYAGTIAGDQVLAATGVEPPVFRLDKRSETLIDTGSGIAADPPDTIGVKIDCPTPGAVIYYDLNHVEVASSGTDPGAYPAIPADPDSGDTLYGAPFEIGTASLTRGNKYFMKAAAIKDGVSAVASEAAFRTMARFDFGVNTPNRGEQSVTNGTGTITGTACSLWIRGGDARSGTVTTPGFPLSWDDRDLDKIRLMTADGTQQWYWMTWEIGVTTYALFILGKTPATLADAELGPAWYGWWNNNTAGDPLETIPIHPGECRALNGNSFEPNSGGTLHARPGWWFN